MDNNIECPVCLMFLYVDENKCTCLHCGYQEPRESEEQPISEEPARCPQCAEYLFNAIDKHTCLNCGFETDVLVNELTEELI